MKKILPLFLAALLALSACSRQAAEAPEAQTPTSPSAAAQSSTMVFAEVFNMTTHPEDYVGKTVKMQGIFSTGKLYAQEGTFEDGGTVFACIIQDATACCAQGIPFDLAESRAYPDDYPELGDPITVTGTFEICTQDGLEFCRLSQAALLDAEI